jgi:N-acetyl-gamma-glutamyl-phosphate reductase
MSIDAVVLGSSGYVGGELLRLIDGHPSFRLGAAVSTSHSGKSLGSVFPNLASSYPDTRFSKPHAWIDKTDSGSDVALFSAAPHGASANLVQSALESAERRNLNLHVVDSSADFRYSRAEQFEALYGISHPAPELLGDFFCGVPEHVAGIEARHAGHPGCFATAILLAAIPLVNSGLVAGDLFVTGITGSTGSGSSPQSGTHHPERHSNLYAYKPLAHRHVAEVERLITKSCGIDKSVRFVPHSGPFARGIYVTLQVGLNSTTTTENITGLFRSYYQDAPFVQIIDETPRLKNIIASNQCHIAAAVDTESAVVMCAIDNLVKGAAGGAMQWMNRLWSLPESTGLLAASPAWT